MDYTSELARYCAELTFDQLPNNVVEKAKKIILDFCGISLGARKIKASHDVVEYIRQNEHNGPCTVIGFDLKTAAPMAALANGSFAEVLEYQDGVRNGGLHPASATLPAALSVAEAENSSGKDFLTAMVAGYEAAIRVARSMYPSHFKRGHLPTGTLGSIGAAVASAHLMGLNHHEMANAIGIAGFVAPMSIGENLWGSYTIKIVHGGYGARTGVEAAMWAKLGFFGCPLEGSPLRADGLCAVASDEVDYEEITEGLGETFHLLEVYFKPYACCRVTHSAVEATLELVEDNDIQASEVTSVDVYTYDYACKTVGANYPDGSDNFLRCQFSLPYVVAAAITDRSVSLPQFMVEKITDPELLDLTNRVKISEDEKLTKLWPATRPSRVVINCKDGSKYEKEHHYPLGDNRNPLSDEQFMDKYRSLVSFGVGEELTPVIERQVMELDEAKDVLGLCKSLQVS